jgi:hypothetical protein
MKLGAILLGLIVACTSLATKVSAENSGALAANSGVQAGAMIDRSNASTYSALLPGALAFAVQHGLSIKVVPTTRVEWPKAYQRVTERYSPQVRLDENGEMQNYVAGLPFPSVSASDPQAALKIAYDWRWGPFIPEQVSFSGVASRTFILSSTVADTFTPDAAHGDFRNELTCDEAVVQRRAHLANGRIGSTDGDIDWRERTDQCGPERGKAIGILYSEPHRLPDLYAYFEATRRWRRLALPLAPSQSCTYTCTQLMMEYMPPKTDLYSWKLAGQRPILGCMNGGPMTRENSDFGQIVCEPRSAYVLDMIPNKSAPDLLRTRVYIDSETFAYLGGEIYRDATPDLSAVVWGKSSDSPEALVVANDMYVPDDRPGTFMLIDVSLCQTFASEISDGIFNPKAQQ